MNIGDAPLKQIIIKAYKIVYCNTNAEKALLKNEHQTWNIRFARAPVLAYEFCIAISSSVCYALLFYERDIFNISGKMFIHN